jgi:hypothetical protein
MAFGFPRPVIPGRPLYYEALAVVVEAVAKFAVICIMFRRLTEPKPRPAT